MQSVVINFVKLVVRNFVKGGLGPPNGGPNGLTKYEINEINRSNKVAREVC